MENQKTSPLQRITKGRIDSLSTPTIGQRFLRDAELRGFAVRVTAAGSKSFVIEKRIDGTVKRITLGRYPDLTVEQARKEAHKFLGKLATGINPIAERAEVALRGVTVAQAFEDFKRVRKGVKARTLYEYERLLNVAFGDWKDKALLEVTKDMGARRHTQLGEERGPRFGSFAALYGVANTRALIDKALAGELVKS